MKDDILGFVLEALPVDEVIVVVSCATIGAGVGFAIILKNHIGH